MSSTTVLRGQPLADELLAAVQTDLERLRDREVRPCLGTVLVSDDEAATGFMDRKHEACAARDIPTERIDLSPEVPAARVYDAVDRLADDEDVTALFVQVPLPAHVDDAEVRERVPPGKDVDCFAPVNLGRLVAGDPWIVPPTTAAVLHLLDAYEVQTAGQDVVIVGRTTAICKPLANLLLRKGPEGDATVTVCHSATKDLGAKTRQADVLVTAAGQAGLVEDSMVSAGVSVVDVSVNRIPGDGGAGSDLVGDVDVDAVAPLADAITPVPGGVGPLTMAFILRNVIDLTARGAGIDLATGPN